MAVFFILLLMRYISMNMPSARRRNEQHSYTYTHIHNILYHTHTIYNKCTLNYYSCL